VIFPVEIFIVTFFLAGFIAIAGSFYAIRQHSMKAISEIIKGIA